MAARETLVEPKAHVVCLQDAPRDRDEVRISHSAYVNRKRISGWTVVGKGSGCASHVQTDLS